jgi:hypothetical protein
MEVLQMEVKYIASYLQIAVEPQKNCLVQIWAGYCTPEEYREGQQMSLELFVENHCTQFISDTTNACPLQDEELDWVVEHITPKLRAAGLSALSIVLPSNIYTKITLDIYEEKNRALSNNTEIRYFGSLGYALDSI